ncbi:TPA: hypothetical protein NJ098_004411 [Vibrio parahaemolyticus]|nr:hypothetical protein [Vibrio parahaemolyticus]
MSSNQTLVRDALVVERYKYIQEKLKYLDSVLHTNISLFIKILSAITALATATIGYHVPSTIPSTQYIALVLTGSALAVLAMTLTFLAMTISNLFAWFGYRYDETELLEKFGCGFTRAKPSFKSFLTWQETWFMLVLSILSLVTFYALNHTDATAELIYNYLNQLTGK